MSGKGKWRFLAVTMAAFSLLLLATGCNRGGEGPGRSGQEQITLAGSTALLPLAQQAKEVFEEQNSSATVVVGAGGSFTGLNQVQTGSVDIGNSDVAVEEAAGFQGGQLVDHKVAVAPFVMITHPQLPVDNLTRAQSRGIFTGQISNWREVGGPDMPVTIIHRPASSGSRAVFQKVILEGQAFTDRAATQDSNGAVRAAVSTTPGSIGYIDVAYLDQSIRPLSLEGVPYSPENVYGRRYPIWSYEHMYTKGEPTGMVKQFLDMVMTPAFQEQYVEKLGFLTVTKMQGK